MTSSGPSVTGPAWTGKGIDESPGRYPLSVEGAVFRLVDRLLPGIITTTRHARMYSLHALAWAEAREQGLDYDGAAAFVRRWEAVIAAIHHLHEPHQALLRSAHGEDKVERFLSADGLDVERAARPGGLSAEGFADVYLGPVVKLGLLSPDRPPHPGERTDLAALRSGLGEIGPLAAQDLVPLRDLEAAGHLCLCAAAGAADGELLRKVLFEDAAPDHHDDRHRQLTCHMLLEAIGDDSVDDVAGLFRERWGFGPLLSGDSPERARVNRGWRAAILRNYSVGAWRRLWSWLAECLRTDPMTVDQLGEQLAAELEGLSVADLVDGLPERTAGEELLAAEIDLEEEDWTPLSSLRMLALGAQRLQDLDRETGAFYLGSDTGDLGPAWVATRLQQSRNHGLDVFGRELVEILVRRARRVALGKMRLREGRPWVPSRLRDHDGLLSAHGVEGAGDVSLRTGSLTEILIGLGALVRDEQGEVRATALGRGLRERTA